MGRKIKISGYGEFINREIENGEKLSHEVIVTMRWRMLD